MKRRLLATFLSLCLLVGLLPTVALAADEETGAELSAVCTCEALCTEEAVDETCPVCAENYTLCAYVAPDDEKEPVSCTATEGCTLEDDHEGACVTQLGEPACAQLEGCVDGVHATDCPLYVEPTHDTLQGQEEPAAQPVTSTESTPNLLNGNEASGPLSGTCGAEGSEADLTWTLTQNNSGSEPATYTLTISGSGAMADFSADTEDTRPWKDYLTSVTEIAIAEGVSSIGNRAFRGMTALEKVNIPSSITDLGDHIFNGDTALTTVEWGDKFQAPTITDTDSNTDTYTGTYLPTSMFDGCTSLGEGMELTEWLPDSFTGIGCAALRGTKFTVAFDTWSNLDYMGAYAFSQMENLDSFVLDDRLTVGLRAGASNAFSRSGIKSLTVDVAAVPAHIAWNASNLTKIILTDEVTSIGENAFVGTAITEFTVPSQITELGNYTFRDCSKLKKVTLEGVTKLNGTPFPGTSLEELVIAEGAEVTCTDNPFRETGNYPAVNALKKISILGEFKSSNKDTRDFWHQCFSSRNNLTEVILSGENVQYFTTVVFPNMKTLYISGGDAVFPGYEFQIPHPLERVIIDVGTYTSISGSFRYAANLTTFKLKAETATLDDRAFYECPALAAVDLTECANVTYGEGTFGTGTTSGVDGTAPMASDAVIYVKGEAFNPRTSGVATGLSGTHGIVAITNGGTFAEGTEFAKGVLAEPTKDGYIFAGWYENDTAVTSAKVGHTYYAKWIDLTTNDITMQYDGSQALPTIEGVNLNNWTSSDENVVKIVDGQLKAVGVGEAVITATASLSKNGETVAVSVTVTPRVLTYTNTDGSAGSGSITYNYSGGHHALSASLTFKWKDSPNTVVELEEGTDINYTYTVTDSEGQGGGTAQTYDYLPMPAGTYNDVQFNLLNENYTFALSGEESTGKTLEIDVVVQTEGSQRAYLASAWPNADQNFVYTGQGVLPVEGTLNAYTEDSTSSGTVDIGTFTVNIEGLNDTTFHSEVSEITAGTNLSAISGLTLPTDPGTYIITASAANSNYYLYKSLVFTISKATVTVKADDKSVYVGDAMPELTYTVSGLASGDSLSGTVSLSCEATDTNTAGTYTITPSGGAVPNTEHYNSEIVYQSGTLTVSTRSSGGGGGSSSGGSSSSNVSGSGDDVSISASGGSVTSSQMESAVNKADEGSTITIKATSSTTVSLPVGGMADAADNDNDVLLDLRYGEVTLSARTIAGLTDGVSSSGKIKVSITSQTSSKDETISDLLDKGAAVFDVSVTVNDVEVHSFDSTLTITLTVSNLSKITDPHILHILTDGTKEYYAPDSISGNTITVKGVRNLSTFAVIPGSEVPEEQTNPFTDVYESDYYYDAVLWAVANGVTNGTSATTFGPNVTVTRAQMVTFLWRAYGSPEATGANPFTDVGTSDYYYDAVLWAVANGVTTGTSATTFSPDAPVTRAQAVTFQWRAAGSPVVSGSSFDDVAADAYYVNAVTWAVANGITNGTGGNNFSPDAAVSRAQAVTFLWRELA